MAPNPDPDVDPKFRCVLGRFGVKTGVIIIGVFELICTIHMLDVVVSFPNQKIEIHGSVGACVISVIVIIALFCGVFDLSPDLLIPFFVWQVVETAIMVVLTIGSIAMGEMKSDTSFGKGFLSSMSVYQKTLIKEAERATGKSSDNFLTAYVILSVVSFLFHVYCFLVVWRFYQYAKFKRQMKKMPHQTTYVAFTGC